MTSVSAQDWEGMGGGTFMEIAFSSYISFTLSKHLLIRQMHSGTFDQANAFRKHSATFGEIQQGSKEQFLFLRYREPSQTPQYIHMCSHDTTEGCLPKKRKQATVLPTLVLFLYYKGTSLTVISEENHPYDLVHIYQQCFG